MKKELLETSLEKENNIT